MKGNAPYKDRCHESTSIVSFHRRKCRHKRFGRSHVLPGGVCLRVMYCVTRHRSAAIASRGARLRSLHPSADFVSKFRNSESPAILLIFPDVVRTFWQRRTGTLNGFESLNYLGSDVNCHVESAGGIGTWKQCDAAVSVFCTIVRLRTSGPMRADMGGGGSGVVVIDPSTCLFPRLRCELGCVALGRRNRVNSLHWKRGHRDNKVCCWLPLQHRRRR